MGKVLEKFINGPAGTVSRENDYVIVNLRNTGATDIAFGAPVFLNGTTGGVRNYDSSTDTFDKFVGFAVRVPDKTPETMGTIGSASPWAAAQAGVWKSGDLVSVLVRGNIVVNAAAGTSLGQPVYIRKNDGAITTNPGADNTTLALTKVFVRTPRDANSRMEITVTARNIV